MEKDAPKVGWDPRLLGKPQREVLIKEHLLNSFWVLGRKYLGRECLKACSMLGAACWWEWGMSVERPLFGTSGRKVLSIFCALGPWGWGIFEH